MKNEVVDLKTGEIVEVNPPLCRFATQFDGRAAPVRVAVRGERLVRDELYEPIDKVMERMERAGALRSLLAQANQAKYDSPEPFTDEDLDDVEFTTGDGLADLNLEREALERLSVVRSAPIPDKASKSTGEPKKGSSDDFENQSVDEKEE